MITRITRAPTRPIARGELALSHQALDSWPAQRAADYVRALLMAHGTLPGRDEALARLERDTPPCSPASASPGTGAP